MQNQLSQREKLLLGDLKNQEEICVAKYQNYAQLAQDPQLNQLFMTLSSEEQKHYDTVSQLLQGAQPDLGQGQSGSQTGGQQGMQSNSRMNQPVAQKPTGQMQNSGGNKSDKILCSDLLSTEKYVSGTYDTSIFESAHPAVRQALQHIQKDEQSHGEQLFQYMNTHGMYQVQ